MLIIALFIEKPIHFCGPFLTYITVIYIVYHQIIRDISDIVWFLIHFFHIDFCATCLVCFVCCCTLYTPPTRLLWNHVFICVVDYLFNILKLKHAHRSITLLTFPWKEWTVCITSFIYVSVSTKHVLHFYVLLYTIMYID